MSQEKLQALMYQVIALREKVDHLFGSINEGRVFFERTSLHTPTFEPYELGFIRTVSYLNVLYKEVGRENVKIAISYFDSFKLDSENLIRNHPQVITDLRTYLLHNLNPNVNNDLKKKHSCEEWFEKKCSTRLPNTEDQWSKCCVSVLTDTNEFLSTIFKCLQLSELDESCVGLLKQWNIRYSREHPSYQFDEVISIAATDMGRENLDIVSFRNRHYDRWKKQLSTLSWPYEFEKEARKYVEGSLLDESIKYMPITGKDIMDHLGIEPGPNVGQLLEEARRLYDDSPCDQVSLLRKLSEKVKV